MLILNKTISADDDDLLQAIGVRNMTAIRVERFDEMHDVQQGTGRDGYIPKIDRRLYVPVRRTVPGDNSCLFHAIESPPPPLTRRYIFNDKSRKDPTYLRHKIAEIIQLYPQKFTAHYLGQENQRYCRSIVNKDTWGGNVELSIFSFMYATRIVVYDLENQLEVIYGEPGFNRMAFIIYTGNHFDVLCLTTSIGTTELDDVVLFNSQDEGAIEKMHAFMHHEHPSMRFVL